MYAISLNSPKKVFAKCFASSLFATLVLIVFSVSIYGQVAQVKHFVSPISPQEDNSNWKNEPFGKYNPTDEIIEKRDEFSKHFRQADGSIVAHIAAGSIHYHENGQWKTIFHSIKPSANGFENITNAHKTYFPAQLGQPLRTVLQGGQELKELLGMEMYFTSNGQPTIPRAIQPQSGQAQFNELTYSNVYGSGIDLRLTQNTTQRKLDYILQNPALLNGAPSDADYMVFRELVELPQGWTARLINNEIHLFDLNGQLQAKYDRPLFYDSYVDDHSHSNENHVHKTHSNKEIYGQYALQQNGSTLEILTKVPMSWLKSANRVYPIYIDPTVTFTPDNSARWTGTHEIYSSATSSNLSTSATYTNSNINASIDDIIQLGRNNSNYVRLGWVKFNISSFSSNVCLRSASINYNVYENNANGTDCIIGNYLRHMSTDPSVVFDATNNPIRLSDIRDGNIYATQNMALLGSGNGWKSINFTNNLNDLIANINANLNWFGVGFHTYEGASGHTLCNISVRGYSNQNKPFLTVTYDNLINGSCDGYFEFTGSDQTYTVPANACEVEVHLWGAGGGGGGGGSGRGGIGGGGGYVTGRLTVTPGENLTVIVGEGGRVNNASGGYGGGGAGGGHANCWAGGGGGRSAIRRGTNELATAGGGGGGAETESSSRYGGAGGAGGAGATSPDGANGFLGGNVANPPGSFNDQGNAKAGKGGSTSTSSGGAAGTSNINGTAGTQFQGGTGARNSNNAGAGGGGGGYFGGGGGAYDTGSSPYGGGGGGGSSFIGGLTSLASATGGSNQTAANATHTYNENAYGSGGNRNSGNSHGSPGQHGRVVIIPVSTCCATTNAGSIQHQNTVLNLCHGQTVSANNVTSTSLNAGNGTLRTVWFVAEWGWNGTTMGWVNWRESTPGTPAGGVYSAHLNASVGGGNGDGQTMTNYNPQIDFPNNNRFYILRGSYNPTCASWCVPACVGVGFEVRIASPIPTPTASNNGPICYGAQTATLSAAGLAPSNKSLAATSAAAQMTIPNTTLGASWTLEAWSRFPLNNSGTYNTLFRNAGGGGGGGDHQILCENGILGSWSNTGTNGPLGFKSSGFNVTTVSAGWHHVAAVASGGITRFYIDGTIVGQISWQSDNSVQLINGLTATQAWGEIDNVRIWNTARSVANIMTDMHRNIPTTDLANLLANYTFDASNGNAINNASFNATGIIDCAFNDVNFFTYTWTGTGAPSPSTNINQVTATLTGSTTFSLVASVNGCSSSAATTTVNVTSPPTGASPQTFCASITPTIGSLSATGTGIKWYGLSSGGSSLPTTFGLSNGGVYYASQTVSGCESIGRLAVTVVVNPVPVSAGISGSTTICNNTTSTLTLTYPSGGTVVDAGGYRTHTFTSSGTLTVPTGFSGLAEVLVIGGGGGGGGIIGGGGGAGGVQFSTLNLTPGAKTVVVGAGGIGGVGWNNVGQQGGQGGNSQFDAITANGGGGGGLHGGASAPQTNLWNGGSGGGSGSNASAGGTGIAGQGQNGGFGGGNNGGGGGGFASVGGNALGAQACCTGGTSGGAGGSGIYFPQFTGNGSPVGWFAGGGGGGTRAGNGNAGNGANGGGTNGTTSSVPATASPNNTGGGGGGGGYDIPSAAQNGGNGGSGIVIIRYYIGTGTWASDNAVAATVSNGTVTGTLTGGTANITYTVPEVGGCGGATLNIPVTVLGGERIAPTGPQCSGTQLNFLAHPNPSVTGTTIDWSVTTPSGMSANPTSGNTNAFSTTLTNTTSGNLSPTITLTQTLGTLSCPRVFTPNIRPQIVPAFNALGPFCVGETPSSLPSSSTNSITGTWDPATISTSSSGSTNYTFTPSSTANCETTALLSITVNSCNNFGEFASAALIQTCSGGTNSNNYFNTTGSLVNQISGTPLQSHNFGAYIQNSGQLRLQGGEMKTWKNNPGNVCGVTLYYRIYPSASIPSGAFSPITLPFYENCNSGSFPSGGPCGGNDQKWQRPGNGNPLVNIDLTTFAPDNYILEIYYDISGSHTSNSNCDAIVAVNNNGNNFTSQFSIISPPTASNTGAYCVGQTIQLNATNGGSTYSWTGPNSFNNNTQNPSITNATTAMGGTYTVSVSTPNNCPVTATTNVVVNPNPNAQITGNLNFCPGGNTTLTASGGGTYVWSPGGENTASISVNAPNTYTVTVTNNGCTAQAQATVSVHALGSIHQITSP